MSDLAWVVVVVAFMFGVFVGNYMSNPDFRDSVNEAMRHIWERG